MAAGAAITVLGGAVAAIGVRITGFNVVIGLAVSLLGALVSPP